MKIGIYPAAFDPVHIGHLGFADTALDMLRLDKIYFLPEPSPREHQGVKAYEHRCNMVQLALRDDDRYGVIMLETADFNITQVWPRLLARFPGAELFMLLGNNAVERVTAWPHTLEFGRSAPTFVVARRGRQDIEQSLKSASTGRRPKMKFSVLDDTYHSPRTSDVRAALRAGNRPMEIPRSVYDYVSDNGLYISGAT